MVGKLLLSVAVVLAFSVLAFAQTDVSFQKDYEDWKKTVSDKDLSETLFVKVRAKRRDEQTTVVHFGIGKTTNDFQISVRLVKAEKDANGKIIVTGIPDSNEHIINGSSDKTEFAQRAYIKKKGSSEANAFEILISVAGKESSKLILELSDKYNYRTFTSIN